MENKIINISVVAEVAAALKSLKDQMVFVGGAVISLYTDDPAADEIRPTSDIDMTLNGLSLGDWRTLQKELANLGFHPDPFGPSICRYKYKEIDIDIIPAGGRIMGHTNKWYKLGFDDLWRAKAKDEDIWILSAPCFLATKLEAFYDRGGDYRTSHDFEDVIYVIDNRTSIVEEISNTQKEIKQFLITELKKLTDSISYDEILSAHIHPLVIEERQKIVKEKIANILSL